ncbi:uncharacterized protein [Haliotis cracherodii]|uniref:uncharacterized protein n=1 Tax=Haliotis cracherodii TaxID=6455 RepID=UPI0039E8FED9
MDNTSAVSFNISDILPPEEIAAECNAANMSSGCDGHGANQTNHLFDSLQHIIETTFTCCDVLNVFGNAVLLLLIYKATTKMEASGRLLMNQAVADAGMGLSWLVLYGIMYTNPHKNVLQTAILVQRIVIGIFTSESTLSLAMTLFALHIAICNPILYKVHYKPKQITIFMAVTWLLNIGCGALALAADNAFVLERDNIIFMNVSKENAWFVCLAVFGHTILPLAIIIIAFTRICLHMRKKENVSITSASATKLYVRQAKGILVVSITYIVTHIPLWVFDSFHIHFKSDNDILLFIIGNILTFLNYVYIVFKLPLFLLAFKYYRRVASQIFCQHLTSGSSSVSSDGRGKLPQRKYQTATNINQTLDDSGHQRSSEDARSTPIQMDETTEMKGNIGRVNHGFTSTCSLYHGDTARPNGANDDVSSSTNDDVSKRPQHHTQTPHPKTTTLQHHQTPTPPHPSTLASKHITSQLHHIPTPPHSNTTTSQHHHTPTPPHPNTTKPQHHHISIPSRSNTITPKHHIPTPPHSNTTTPQHHHTPTPPHPTTTKPQHHHISIPSRSNTITPKHHIPTPPHSNTTTPQHHQTPTPSHLNTITFQHHHTQTPHPNTTTLQHHHIPTPPNMSRIVLSHHMKPFKTTNMPRLTAEQRERAIGMLKMGARCQDHGLLQVHHRHTSQANWKYCRQAEEWKTQGHDPTGRPWPARSSDLSPIEHLWDQLGRRIRKRQQPPLKWDALAIALQEEWRRIPNQDVRRLVYSVRRCVRACIVAGGGHVRY